MPRGNVPPWWVLSPSAPNLCPAPRPAPKAHDPALPHPVPRPYGPSKSLGSPTPMPPTPDPAYL